MLVGFTFTNFMSFFEESVFSMMASSDTAFQHFNVLKTSKCKLLKNALIFGANSSGKSNFISAIACMRKIVLADHSNQSKLINDINIFKLYEPAHQKPTSFEVRFIVKDLMYEYGFEILKGEISKEYLRRKDKRFTYIFNRTSPNNKDIEINKELQNIQHLIDSTRRDNLFLYWLSGGNIEIAMLVYDWFNNLIILGLENGSDKSHDYHYRATADYIIKNEEGKNNILKLLQKVDINILDIEIVKDNPYEAIELLTKHQSFNINWHKNKTIETKINFESLGTRKLLELSGPIIKALENGYVIFIDEIDSRLHPLLEKLLIMLFNTTNDNPHNAQLICNTHNVQLLDEDIRRDQVYFTEKDEKGRSKIYSLADFKGVRKESKLLRRYLLGAFGATPKIKDHL